MVAIIDYGMGNVASVKKALKKINYESIITKKLEEINHAKYIILPGVGSFRLAMENLNNLGLVNILTNQVIEKKKPIIGICLGMQLLASMGYEDGQTAGLGFIEGDVVKINSTHLPIPHIGWNDISISNDMFFSDIKDFNFYFVHSYYFNVKKEEECIGKVDYEHSLPAVIHKGNIFGTQFHPEKSQASGLQLLKNFLTVNA